MSDQPEEKPKPKGFLNKLTAFWNNLSNSIKAFSGVLAAILVIFSQFDKIQEKFFPKISDELLDSIVYFDTLSANQKEYVFNKCSDFKTQCLQDFLSAGEKMRSSDEAQGEVIDWIFLTYNKLGNNDVYDVCLKRANEFLDVEINALSNKEDIYNGFGFYIGLFKKFETLQSVDIKPLFNTITLKIDQSDLHPLSKKRLYGKINQES